MTLTVACVFWKGDFRGRPYKAEWVRRLKSMVARNLTMKHRFVCLSNVEVDGVETIPLTENLPGWWSKVELFDVNKLDEGRILYLDLDTLIVGNLDDIVTYPSRFATMPPYYRIVGGKPQGGPGVVDKYQSSVMVWDAWQGREVFSYFTPAAMDLFRGDQDWISQTIDYAQHLPGEWFLKLKDCQDGPPKGVKVVLSMPWKNEDAAAKFKWVEQTWV